MLASMTSTLVTRTLEETVETAKAVEIARTSKNGRKNKGKYPENPAQVLCI